MHLPDLRSHLEHDDGLLQSVFDLYYNPGLSVIGDEIVGLADIDLYGGSATTSGPALTFSTGRQANLATAPDSFSTTRQFPCTGGAQSGIRATTAASKLAQAVHPRGADST